MDQNWLNAITLNSVDTADKQRRAFTLFTMAFFAIVLITSLVLSNYQIYALPLTIMLVVSDITIVLCMLYYFRTGALVSVSCIILSIILLLCVALVYTGGKENTALYWLMFYPIVAYVTLGLKVGSVLVGIMYASAVALLFSPNFGQAHYGQVETSRFLASFTMVILFSGISEYFRQKSHQKIADITLIEKRDALTDPLTGLANRRYIYEHIQPRLEAEAANYLPMSVLLIDLDNFKSLNDTYGHDFGDQALIAFTSMLHDKLRGTDIKARYGGEEFIILLPKAGLSIAHAVAEKLRSYVAEKQIPYDVGQSVTITCSIGIASLERGSQFSKAIKQADDNLYKAKAKGRNVVVSDLTEIS
ncbi:GGDEF domain-containing protein [Pseudoalteromonas shioyasakiensis]|uniref:GGDEF domain-containing protein n=1 Tax=Pseudoalteromonas shioyasakiensis TaxID=1190813 RepID=UPI0020CCBCC1|nr:diguanylate cyclase [Pseudoalteromonas shioyasakiensis]